MNRKIRAMSIAVRILLVTTFLSGIAGKMLEKTERSVDFSSQNEGGDRNG